MRKNKIKLSIIEDYIAVCQMESYLKYLNQYDQLEFKINKLKKQYEQVLFRIGGIDLSFQLLKQNIANDENKLLKINKENHFAQKFNFFEENLKVKMEKLHFNEFEINFIVNFS